MANEPICFVTRRHDNCIYTKKICFFSPNDYDIEILHCHPMTSSIGIALGATGKNHKTSNRQTPYMIICSLRARSGKCIAEHVVSYIRLFIDQMHACSSLPYFLPVNYFVDDQTGETLVVPEWQSNCLPANDSFVSILKHSLRRHFGDKVVVDDDRDHFRVFRTNKDTHLTSLSTYIDTRALSILQ